MSVIVEEKENSKVLPDTEDLEYKIEIATQILDRNIGFVTNCDNKTSIVLATFGVLLAIILTNEGVNEIFNIVKTCIEAKSFCHIFYLVCFTGAIFLLVWGCLIWGAYWLPKPQKKLLEERTKAHVSFLRE